MLRRMWGVAVACVFSIVMGRNDRGFLVGVRHSTPRIGDVQRGMLYSGLPSLCMVSEAQRFFWAVRIALVCSFVDESSGVLFRRPIGGFYIQPLNSVIHLDPK